MSQGHSSIRFVLVTKMNDLISHTTS